MKETLKQRIVTEAKALGFDAVRFASADAAEGAGAALDMFLAEGRQGDMTWLADTLKNRVVGGCAFMTVHADATMQALSILPGTWFVGMVLMNQNCPQYLRTDGHRVLTANNGNEAAG
jgi:hypothetical protein